MKDIFLSVFKLSLLLIIAVSCNMQIDNAEKETENEIILFSENLHPEAEAIEVPEHIQQVLNMQMDEEKLVLFDMRTQAGEHYFHQFNTSDFNYIGGFFDKGNKISEKEELYPSFQLLDNNKVIYRTQKRATILQMDNSLQHYSIVKQIQLPKSIQTNGSYNILYQNGNIYGLPSYSENKNQEYIKISASGEINAFGPEYPNIVKEVPRENRASLCSSSFAFKPDGTQLAAAYSMLPRIRISTSDGSLTQDIQVDGSAQPADAFFKTDATPAEIEEIVQYYIGIETTDDFIYALYNGENVRLVPEDAEPDSQIDYNTEVHVFDWNGNPIKKIRLQHPTNIIAVAPNDEYFIASATNINGKIYKYDLN